MLKEQKGITLVALVITIIVLLILAGVSISLVMGENGVLTQATGAVVSQKIASAKEKIESSVAAMEMQYKTDWAANTSASRSDTYAGKADDGSLNTTLAAFVTELKANGLTPVEASATAGAKATSTETTIPADTLAAKPASGDYTYTTIYFEQGSDSFEVSMVIDSASGALVFNTVKAWNGSAYAEK